ncbi:MAG TPA: class I SAM-dependent methyltransferase [Patescibacteria group bacterium]|nr:class I SAM-dependent methyltransferase [Patescibacteria group bacterium]
MSEFLIRHLFRGHIFPDRFNILEPGCGDGQFLQSLFTEDALKDYKNVHIDFLDVNQDELQKAQTICEQNKSSNIKFNSYNIDFLDFQKSATQQYSLIIGNPPYIKKIHLSEDQIEQCQQIYTEAGLSSKSVHNIWTGFLLGSTAMLNEEGVLCFVLPSEFLQVKYTKEIREYILTQFRSVEIFAFNQLIFEGVEQDVIVFIGAKNNMKRGISFFQVENLNDLTGHEYTTKFNNVHRKTLDKWTNYILTDEELIFLEDLRKTLKPIKAYCEKVEVGIVTAANSYFIVNDKVVKNYQLDHIVKPLIGKGAHIKNQLRVTEKLIEDLHNSGKPVNFIHFRNEPPETNSLLAQEYIKKGEALGLHNRYKCKNRNNWYHVPCVWLSEGLFIKRTHLYPRMLLNDAGVYVTDSFYRVKMKGDFKITDLVFSFYNTLTFILAELEGRYYGGGVLELTPNEYKHLAIPFFKDVPAYHLLQLEHLFKNKSDIKTILNYTNRIILGQVMRLSVSEIERLGDIYEKLVSRRLKKPNKSTSNKKYIDQHKSFISRLYNKNNYELNLENPFKRPSPIDIPFQTRPIV